MARELAVAVARLVADSAPSPDQSSGVTIALIGLAGVVTTTFVTAVVTLRSRNPGPPQPLNSDTAGGTRAHETAMESRVDALERFCYRNHIDPTRIATGEESIADVHFD